MANLLSLSLFRPSKEGEWTGIDGKRGGLHWSFEKASEVPGALSTGGIDSPVGQPKLVVQAGACQGSLPKLGSGKGAGLVESVGIGHTHLLYNLF